MHPRPKYGSNCKPESCKFRSGKQVSQVIYLPLPPFCARARVCVACVFGSKIAVCPPPPFARVFTVCLSVFHIRVCVCLCQIRSLCAPLPPPCAMPELKPLAVMADIADQWRTLIGGCYGRHRRPVTRSLSGCYGRHCRPVVRLTLLLWPALQASSTPRSQSYG